MSDKLNELIKNSWSYPVMAEGGDNDGDGRLDPHKMLVTDANGKKIWQDRLAYTVVAEQEIIPLHTRKGSNAAYLNDKMTVNPTAGDVYIVEINGEKYESVIKAEAALGGFYLGNAHLFNASYEDTGESFVFVGLRVNISKSAYFSDSGTHTFRVYGQIEENTPIPAKYLPGGIKSGVGINSLAVNDVPSENVTAPNSFAANSGKAKQTNAFGVNTGEAQGYCSFASGDQTFAKGDYSFSSGFSTVASGRSQFVSGSSNVEDAENKYANIVGNGADALTRSNAHTIDWDGVGWFAGGLKVGGTGQDDEAAQEVALKSDVTACVEEIVPFSKNGSTVKCAIPFVEAAEYVDKISRVKVILSYTWMDTATRTFHLENSQAMSVSVEASLATNESIAINASFRMLDGTIHTYRFTPDETVTEIT